MMPLFLEKAKHSKWEYPDGILNWILSPFWFETIVAGNEKKLLCVVRSSGFTNG